MYHSITFGTEAPTLTDGIVAMPESRNTWDSWHLIPSSRPSVASPGISTNYVEIPGRSGALDLTTYLTGGIVYGQRSGSWEFIVDNDHEYWESIRYNIMTYLHGQERYIILEDVPLQYWVGRFSVDIWKSEAAFSRININYVLDPYSKSVYDETDDWLWDPFNFDMDYTDSANWGERL